MSFGVGLADIFEALHFVKVTYEAWKDAPEKYREITQRLRSLKGPLQHLATHYEDPPHRKAQRSQRDLLDLLSTIDNTLQHLTRILDKRSGLKFWDRLRLNAHEINDLSAALDRHILDLTCFSSSLCLQNNREIQHGQQDLLRLVSQLLPPKVPLTTIEAVTESADSVSMSSSFMTDYSNEDDDPAVWRAFRRKAIAEGVTSRDLEVYQAPLHDILCTVAADRHRGRRRRQRRLSDSAEQERDKSFSPPSPYNADRDVQYTYSPAPEEERGFTHYLGPSREPRGRQYLLPVEDWREQLVSRPLHHDSDAVHVMTRERSQWRRRQRSRSVGTGVETESHSEAIFLFGTVSLLKRKC